MVAARECCDDPTLHPPKRVGEHRRAGDWPRLGLDSLELRRRAPRAPPAPPPPRPSRAPPKLLRHVALPLVKHADGEMMRVPDHLDHPGRALHGHHDHRRFERGLADPVGGYAVLIALTLHGERVQAVGEMSEDRPFRGRVHGKGIWYYLCPMATRAQPRPRAAKSLSKPDLLDMYRLMLLSRRIDDKEIQLKRQNKIFFQISGAGHEAVLVAAGRVIRPAYDWFYPYYRDRALCLSLGMTPTEMFLSAVGAAEDPNSGGRQMPSHWGHKALNIVSQSSPTGTQLLQAVGCAEAWLRYTRSDGIADKPIHGDELVYVSVGDGATSEGEFWEALNIASNLKLPVLVLVEDNKYAITFPVEVQTAGGSVSKLVANFPDLLIAEVDGCDPVASYEALVHAADYCRQRQGPAFVHAHVTRPYSHSLSDDEVVYKPPKEREEEARRDCTLTFPQRLIAEGVATEAEIAQIRQQVDEEVELAADMALGSPQPTPESALRFVYSPDVDPTSEQFDTEDDPQFSGDPTTMVDLLNACLKDEMARDPRILVFGEDVADVSREQYLKDVKGKGGGFKVTWGLQRQYGSERVYNWPLAEP